MLIVAALLLLGLAGWQASAATSSQGRMPRLGYVFLISQALSLVWAPAIALWRHVFPAGRASRLPVWAATLLVLAAIGASQRWLIPILFFRIIDPIGNRRELARIQEGLSPLLADIRHDTRGLGRPPDDIAPLLDRHLGAPPGWLYPTGASNGGARVLYFPGPARFALAVWGTPLHRDQGPTPGSGPTPRISRRSGARRTRVREPPWTCVSVDLKGWHP